MLPLLETPSFLGGLGKGLNVGLEKSAQSIQEILSEKRKQKKQEAFLRSIGLFPKQEGSSFPSGGTQGPSSMAGLEMPQKEELFRSLASQLEQQTGKELQPADLDQLWKGLESQGLANAAPQQQSGMRQPTIEDALAARMMGYKDLGEGLEASAKYHQKERLEERKLEASERKETRPITQNIIEGYEQAELTDAYVDRLEQLDKEGVVSPTTAGIVEYFGLPVGYLGKSSEEMQKIARTMSTNVAKVYGFGNIRAIEFQNFLESLPSLMNTKEGRARIYQVMRYKSSLDKARYHIYKDIVERNKGKVPTNIDELVVNKMQPEYKKFGQILKFGYEPISVVSPDGVKGYIPKEDLEEAKKSGYRILEGG